MSCPLASFSWHPIVGLHRRANMGAAMAYTLKEFCVDHHALLTSGQPLAETLPRIADKLDPAPQSRVRRRELQRRYAGRETDLASRSRHRCVCVGACLRGAEEG